MTNFTLNGKEYNSTKDLNSFEALIELEDLGLAMADISEKPLNLIACLVAYFAGLNKKEAITEINSHVLNGGKLTDFNPLIEQFTSSDFFQAMQA